ncbi:hypothetical protein FO519_003156 [Halicephalobus sp. NKZ332]|nr:hypothetical protein FO519_003156 [Halicephalobus sp. NKZ332]
MDFVLDILSVTATTSTIGLFLCGVPICQRIQEKGSTDGTSVAPFLLTSISCVCWFGYGIIRDDNTIIFVNGIGFRKLNRLIFLEFFTAIATAWYVRSSHPMEEKENILGVICMFLNIATIGSPLADLGTVIRNKSTESLPFSLCVMNMGVSVQWLAYGILADDFYMKVPNAVAVVISAIQLSLFFIYPTKYAVLNSKGPNEIL